MNIVENEQNFSEASYPTRKGLIPLLQYTIHLSKAGAVTQHMASCRQRFASSTTIWFPPRTSSVTCGACVTIGTHGPITPHSHDSMPLFTLNLAQVKAVGKKNSTASQLRIRASISICLNPRPRLGDGFEANCGLPVHNGTALLFAQSSITSIASRSVPNVTCRLLTVH